jgi:hypothetical protein
LAFKKTLLCHAGNKVRPPSGVLGASSRDPESSQSRINKQGGFVMSNDLVQESILKSYSDLCAKTGSNELAAYILIAQELAKATTAWASIATTMTQISEQLKDSKPA